MSGGEKDEQQVAENPKEPIPLLEMNDICKSFPGVRALDGVHFNLYPGEVHALMGENGAGKSTLIGVLAGAHRPDSGTIRLNGAAKAHDLALGRTKRKGRGRIRTDE